MDPKLQGPEPESCVGHLEVQGLCKCFGRSPALREVSFDVGPGEIVGFVGPNGAGKSTTFRIICGLLRASSGTVRMNGFDVRDRPLEFRESLGALLEAPGYYPGLTATQHLEFVARTRGCDQKLVLGVLEEVGLAAGSRKRVSQFSLGMKQRLGIAMALMHGPKLLVLDEPMNGLDPLGMAGLRDLLQGLGRTRGVTILISSHLLHEVEQICDRVLFISDGRLLTEATLTREMLAQIESVGLRTTDDGRTRELLTREPFVREIALSAEGLECHIAAEDVPRIAPVLVGAGIGIRAITPRRRSLEDVYLSHYAGRTEGGIE